MGNFKALMGGDSGGTGSFNKHNTTDGATGSTFSIPESMSEALEGQEMGEPEEIANTNLRPLWRPEPITRFLRPL